MKRFLLLITFCLLCSCHSSSSTKIVFDYTDVSTHIDWKDVFVQDECEYMVYFYSLSCGHCKELKQYILDYYFAHDDLMFFVETSKSEDAKFGKDPNLIGACDISTFYILGTPSLFKILDGKVYDFYSGVSQIKSYLHLN